MSDRATFVSKGFKLSDVDPDEKGEIDKDDAKAALAGYTDRLAKLQEKLFAEEKQSLLVVFQAMDTGGKDGTIRSVFGPLNAIGTQVHSFGKPSERELAQDFLWRVHPHAPERGQIVIFNRSHYEDVLIVRVHGWADDKTIRARFEHITAFERLLAERRTKVVKFFLHISRDEQKQRLEERLADPTKRWKFNPGDLPERAKWDDYMVAFEDAMRETSTKEAPWFVVPANRKWYRNILVARTLVETLEEMDPKYPEPSYDWTKVVIE
ncbi:MAG: polyphosphate kinase 2 family protein [Polyangiaceae bacterium]